MAKHKHFIIFYIIILSILNCSYQSENPKYYLNKFGVHLANEVDPNQVAEKYGFINLGKIGNLENHYLFEHKRVEKRSTEYSHVHHSILSEDPEVVWVEQQHVKRRSKRDNDNSDFRYQFRHPMSDPLFNEMWYLNKGARGGFDMNVAEAWAMGYTGKGVVVTILDDGIQPNHPDLATNYDPNASYDINDDDPDPTPQDNGDNKHGTRCAGEVAGEAYNDYCGVGIAFNASIGGVRMLDGTVTDEVEAKALSLNPNHVDIYSASWGPEDDGKTVDGPGRLAQRAFIDGIRKGRHGKGSIFIWASGNGGRRSDNCNCDGYTNSIYTLSISSATQNGAKPWYLEECSSTLATTYSSGTPGRDQNVITVDQDTSFFKSLEKGEEPNTSKLCTRSHTGTSASAPIAAGIASLALEANPQLTWRDLQHLVILSSRYEPLRHESGWITNGVGRKVSHKFGYGLIDAHAMVKYAEKWPPLPQQKICETTTDSTEREIPVRIREQLQVSMITEACRDTHSQINYLEHVQAKITLKFRPRGNLKITLISPSGTASNLLLPRPRDAEESTFNNWPFLSVHFWGERAEGTWTLIIQNDGSRQGRLPGKLLSWSLVFLGTSEKPKYHNLKLNETIHYLPRRTYQSNANRSECSKDGLFKMIDSKECVKHCPNGEWADYETGTCQKCHEMCKTCFGPTSDTCLSCNETLYFYGYHCVQTCTDTHYADVKLKECLPCSSNCRTCEKSPSNCVNCRPFFTLDQYNRCLPPCDKHTNSSNCKQCHSTCLTCSGKENYQCTSCRDGRRLLGGLCTDEKCPSDHFESQNKEFQTSECLSCHFSCKSCDGPSHKNCTSCYLNSTLDDGMCYSCLDGQFMNPITRACDSCHPKCSSCNGPTLTDCTNCEPPYYLEGTRCLPCCPTELNQVSKGKYFSSSKIDCCHCLSSNGPCKSAFDQIRSVYDPKNEIFLSNRVDSEKIVSIFVKNPLILVLTICFTSIFIFSIVFITLQLKSSHKDLRATNVHQYSKVSTKETALLKSMELDEDTEEDCLYEKT